MVAKPPAGDGKKAPPKPGKGFDPKAEDWQKRGKASFVDKKTISRPFKGGGRGR